MGAIQNICVMVLFHIFQVVVSSPLLEKYEDFPCPNEKQEYILVYKPAGFNISKCEQTWDFAQKPIAELDGRQCVLPCLQVSPGEIRLAQRINVTLKMFCSVQENTIEETRVHFHGNSSCSQLQRDPKEEPPATKGQNYHIGLWCFGGAVCAFCAVLAFLFIKQRTRPRCQNGIHEHG